MVDLTNQSHPAPSGLPVGSLDHALKALLNGGANFTHDPRGFWEARFLGSDSSKISSFRLLQSAPMALVDTWKQQHGLIVGYTLSTTADTPENKSRRVGRKRTLAILTIPDTDFAILKAAGVVWETGQKPPGKAQNPLNQGPAL